MRANYMIRDIQESVFPARLPARVAEAIAVRCHEVHSQLQIEETRLAQEANLVTQDQVFLADMTIEDRVAVEAYRRARAELESAEAVMRARGFGQLWKDSAGQEYVYRPLSRDAAEARKASLNERRADLARRRKAVEEELRDITQAAASAHVKKIREALPEDLVARLDAVGTKMLPAKEAPDAGR